MQEFSDSDLRHFFEYLQIVYGGNYTVSTRNIAVSQQNAVSAPPQDYTGQLTKQTIPTPVTNPAPSSELMSFFQTIKNCQACHLGATRKNLVFGSGSDQADLMIIGEAPGADEDAQGFPFVGRAGQLLTKILEAIGLSRDDVYIANILKCRPPNNRDPLPDEVAQCRPHLNKQIEIIKPKVLLLLGRVAAQTLFDSKDSLKSMRGRMHRYNDIDVFVTYHPAALLRNPHWKRPTWEDVQKVRDHLQELKQVTE